MNRRNGIKAAIAGVIAMFMPTRAGAEAVPAPNGERPERVHTGEWIGLGGSKWAWLDYESRRLVWIGWNAEDGTDMLARLGDEMLVCSGETGVLRTPVYDAKPHEAYDGQSF